MYIQEATGKHLMIKGGDVSKPLLDDALERLYLEQRFCPTFILLSIQPRPDGSTDYHAVYQQMTQMSSWPQNTLQEEHARFYRLFGGTPTLLYMNQTTGLLTPIFGYRYLPSRTMIFGSYEADTVIHRPPQYDVWAQVPSTQGEHA